jgi:predicted membrane GTPase involved in stress response
MVIKSFKTTELISTHVQYNKAIDYIRAGTDDKIVLSNPRAMSLEEALAYMGDDEIVEVTSGSVRVGEARKNGKGDSEELRKSFLDHR